MKTLDVFWSFRSPYSYLANDRLGALVDDFDVTIAMRFVRPLALREDGFFKRARPQFLPYLLKDAIREGERLGAPVIPPRPDPITMDMATGEVAAAQPFFNILMRAGMAAETEYGAGFRFAHAAAKRVWGGTENWHEGSYLADAAAEAGLDFDDLNKWADGNGQRIDDIIAENEKDQLAHHWGVPLMLYEGEPFFGQDRMDSLRWRLEQNRASA